MSPPKIAIVAAMPGEIRPLVRDWQRSSLKAGPRRYRVYQRGRAFALSGGMGVEPIRAASRAIVAHAHPDVLISAGWAGSLRSGTKVADIIVPEMVIETAEGRAFRTFCGAGTLVTAAEVIDPTQKGQTAARHSAQAIDMEAAAVAEVAQETNTKFLAVKVIFDELDFPMPPVDRFRSARGHFCYGEFLAFLALRPGLWPTVRVMQRNASLSARSLCGFLEKLLACDSLVELQQLVAKHALGVPL